VLVSRSLTYTVTVVNNTAAVTVTNVVLTNTLSGTFTFVSAAPLQGSCTGTTQVVCTLGSIRGGGNTRVVIVVTPTAAGTVSNTARVSSVETDPTPGNNTASASTTVSPLADLALTISDAPDPVTAGQSLAYLLTVTNNGPSSASNVTITDTLPALTTYQSFTGAGWTCAAIGGGRVRCTLATLNAAANSSVTLNVLVSSAATSALTNTAVVGSSATDLTPANNTAIATTAVQTSADLRINKVDSVDPVAPGTSMAYTIFITNTGPSDAVGVRITDTLPSGVSYSIHVPTSWTCTLVASDVRCSQPASLTANTSTQLALVVAVDINASGTLSNQVRVGATTPDPLTTNNTDTETTAILSRSDLRLTKVASSNPVIAGTNLTYTLTVSNDGPSNAASLVVTDTLPANLVYQSYGGSSGWTCTLLTGNRLRCTRPSLNYNTDSKIRITGKVNSGATGSLTNNAVVSSAGADPTPGNNTASLVTTVTQSADLRVTKTDSPDPVAEGQTLTYRVVVKNDGPSNAASVSLSDPLPVARVTYISYAAVPQGTCTWASPNLNCNLGTIVSGNAITVTVTTTAKLVGDNSPKTASNSATATSATTDPNSANNSQAITTQVLPAADLRLNLESTVAQVQSGNPLTYTLWITNTGPSIANNVVVTDTLPAELTYKSSTRPPVRTAPQVVWNLGDLGLGQAVSFNLVVNVKSPTKTLVNSAVVRSATVDVVPANSQDQVTVHAIDSVKPTVIWRKPVRNAQFKTVLFGEDILLEVEAEDNVAVSYVRFSRWNYVSEKWIEIGIDSVASACSFDPARLCYQWLFNTSVLLPNYNEIQAQAYDASGNYPPNSTYYIWLKYFGEQVFLPLIRK
jgi:uncharacterized repeat protein (TIGR01451 family)